MRRLTLALVVLVLVLGGGALWVRSYLATPLAVAGEGYTLEVPTGASWSMIVGRLATDRVVRYPAVLAAWGRLTGQAGRIQAGEYQLAPGLTPVTLLDLLESGRVVLHKLTLVEGWTVRQMLAALRGETALRHTLKATGPEDLARELGLDWPSAEGAFLPETYLFARGDADRDLLGRAHAALKAQLDEAWRNRQADLPLATPYELLVLASIVERETALPAERPRIAGVFVRRLETGMRLQTDPTVIYGIGPAFDGNLTRANLETDTPWNTYTRAGLPPTPIAAAGVDAMAAAARPAGGTALFFVATGRGDGSHRFSTTLREHEAAVRDYLAATRQGSRQGARE